MVLIPVERLKAYERKNGNTKSPPPQASIILLATIIPLVLTIEHHVEVELGLERLTLCYSFGLGHP